MKTFEIFLKPIITEKATSFEKDGKYQFMVRKDATKIDVKEAFKKLYGVEVSKVNVMRTAEKMRMGGGRRAITKKTSFKKVLITTKAKKTVDVAKPKLKI